MRLLPLALLLSAATLVVRPLSAATPDKGRIALGVEFGLFSPIESSYDSGFSFGGTFDYYQSDRLGVRATAVYSRSGTTLAGEPDHSIANLLVSGVYRWPLKKLHPFAQAGAGLYVVDPGIGGRTARIGANLGGGVEYMLNRRTAVSATGLLHILGSAGDRKATHAGLNLGLRYYF